MLYDRSFPKKQEEFFNLIDYALNKMKHIKEHWTICPKCFGRGKKNLRLRKEAKIRYQIAMAAFEKTKREGKPSVRPKITQLLCNHCHGSGLIPSEKNPIADRENYPHVAIIGAGIGGIALAVACLHRGIPFTLYERDTTFDARAQGYGLTLQQASNAIKGLGLFSLKEKIHSSRHVVHTTEGKEITEWGVRTHANVKKSPKRINAHIPRQSLRLALLEQLGSDASVQWGHKLVGFTLCEDKSVELSFQVNGEMKNAKADLVVGADGIRSVVRSLLIGEDKTPLRYLGYMVILGICSLQALKRVESCLLDSATVFQTVNGHERIYIMPYSADAVMWQLSFPLSEQEAKTLSAQGAKVLKEEACRIANWHQPIPEIVSGTPLTHISGYPIYDRELLKPELLEKAGPLTLIGDAAHPMSPFKGQGANQALLDALALARSISIACTPPSHWREIGLRESVLTGFEEEMLTRSAVKVKASAEAVELLHSQYVLREGYEPKGRSLPTPPQIT
ncbi:MAG: hypothetical protein RLZZ453_185 [Chlamydiota bacterium]